MAIEHVDIPDGERHEPKGVSTASLGQVYVANGAASGTWASQAGSLQTRIVVTEASQLASIDATKEYFIDGTVDMGTQSINVPAGGLTISGYGLNKSFLTSTAASYTMFTGNTAGNVFITGLAINVSGAASEVFDLDNNSAFGAIEMVQVNFENCTSMGTLSNYRQALELNTGRFGGTPNLTLEGTWVGGYRISTAIVRSLSASMTGALFQEGGAFVMNNRFLTDINCDLPAGAALMDFQPTNFPNPNTFLLQGISLSRNGVFDTMDANLVPNILKTDVACLWRSNTGIGNTYRGGRRVWTATAATPATATPTDLLGTLDSSELQHFDAPTAYTLRYIGGDTVEFEVEVNLELVGDPTNLVRVDIVYYDDSAATETILGSVTREIINLTTTPDRAYFIFDEHVAMSTNDTVRVQVVDTGIANVTAQVGSRLVVEER
jgi:hypothetical protein